MRITVLAAMLLTATLGAQTAEAPSLTEAQKLKIQNIAIKLENAQLRAQAAQHDFEKAKSELEETVRTLQKDGWQLDLSDLANPRYVKTEKSK